MKTVILVRHGKSDWSMSQPDALRGLTDGGKRDVELIAMAGRDLLPPDFDIICSSAARAIATAQIFCKAAGIPYGNINYLDKLYTFSVAGLEAIIRSTDDNTDSLLVFGHNEAFTDFINKFGSRRIDNLPTSGFAKISFDAERWSDINNGTTLAVLFPKELRNG